jgi:hypothetical protein
MKTDPEQNHDVAALEPAVVKALREEISNWKRALLPP